MHLSRNDLKDELELFGLSLQRALRDKFDEVGTRLASLERTVKAVSDSQPVIMSATAPPSSPMPLYPSPPKAEPPSLRSDITVPASTEGAEIDKAFSGITDTLVTAQTTKTDTCTTAQTNKGRISRPGSENENHEWLRRHFRTYTTGKEARREQIDERKRRISAQFGVTAVKSDRSSFADRGSGSGFKKNNKKVAFGGAEWRESQSGAQLSSIQTIPDGSYACRAWISILVQSQIFQLGIAILIAINAFTLGLQTDFMATRSLKDTPVGFRIVEVTFLTIFTVEIILKLIAHRCWYFVMPGWGWNVFDCILVLLQLIQEFVEAAVPYSLSNFSAMRVMRILRVVRVIRMIRLIRMISDLRAIVASVVGSMRALAWTIVILFGLIYMISVYVTQLYVEERAHGRPVHEFARLYDTLPRSMLTLYQSVAGGIDWDTAVEPLISDLSPWFGLVFSLYIAFTVLALMNVVTGVFVETALRSAREDKDIYIVNHIRSLIDSMEQGEDGLIGWDAFEAKLASHDMAEVFNYIDVDPTEARGLFNLLDMNHNGSVDSEEFLDGCLRLRGPAKALDMALLMSEMKRLVSLQMAQFDELAQVVGDPKKVNLKNAGTLRHAATDVALDQQSLIDSSELA